MYDYSQGNNNSTNANSLNDYLEIAFTLIFVVEALLKITGMGFVMHKNSYMREGWNILDFFVVLVSAIDFLPNIPSFKSFRMLRILRPLRSINAIPSMRILLSTLFISIPQLGSVLIFLLFVFLLFGIFGINQYSGTTYQMWRTTPVPTNSTYWEKVVPYRRCGGNQGWAQGHYWGDPMLSNFPLEYDDVLSNPTINYGITSFDNLFSAMITIFQVITKEGWSEIMYMLDDTSGSFMTAPFLILLVIIGSFFLLNLILAVIMRVFTQNNEIEKIKQRKLKIILETKQLRKRPMSWMAPINIDHKPKRSLSFAHQK